MSKSKRHPKTLLQAIKDKPTSGECRLFVLCTEAPTTSVDHPILGKVACCEKHKRWYHDFNG